METVTSTSPTNQESKSARSKKAAKEERINMALRDAVYMHSDSKVRWAKLIHYGAHDNEIWHALLKEFGTGGSSQTTGGDQFAFQGGDGAAQPKFWFSQGTHYTNEKPTLAGARLVKRVRELLKIPPYVPASTSAETDDAASLDDTAEKSDASGTEKDYRTGLDALDLGFLADLEETQRGLWATVCEYDRLIEAATKKREVKRLKSEREDVFKDYEAAYDEAVTALSGNADIVQEVRDRIESGSIIAESGDASELTDEALIDLLGLISIAVDLSAVQSWTPEQREKAEAYAAAVHLKAGDNDDVVIPTRPDFLPEEREWHEYYEQTPGAGCILKCGKPEDDPIHRSPIGDRAAEGGCPNKCGHTNAEHTAFDLGVRDGERGIDGEACPYDSVILRDAWQTGHSVGMLNRDTPATEVAPATPAAFKRELECELTDDDLLIKLSELTSKLTEKDSVEQELKEVSAGYKGRIKTLDREIHSLTRVVTKRQEARPVECRELFNFDGYVVQIMRLDTEEIIETRTMTQRERQQSLLSI